MVIGLFSTRSGIGRGGELVARGLEHEGREVIRVDLPLPWFESVGHRAALIAECQHNEAVTDLVVVLPPPLFLIALAQFDATWLARRSIVAHWVWEFEVLPRWWLRSAMLCDEIWCSSEFVEEAVRRSVPGISTKTVPYSVDLDPVPQVIETDRQRVRQQLAIPSNAYVVGYSFAVSSNLPRKNPQSLVAAFKLAFPDDNARLLLRALDGDIFPRGWRQFKNNLTADPRIILVEQARDLSIQDFYSAIDLYASPARCEGYGLNLAEAAQAGIPVVTVGWTIGTDILRRPSVTVVDYTLVHVRDPQGSYPGLGDARWAEPNLHDFAVKLRAAAEARGPIARS